MSVQDNNETFNDVIESKDKQLLSEENCDDRESEEASVKLTCCQRFFGPIRSGSLRGSTFAMASIVFGGGCLAFPYVISKTGPIVGFIIFMCAALISLFTLQILMLSGNNTKILDYNGLILYTMGKKMLIFSDINNLILCLGVIMSYQFTVYKFALQLGFYFFGLNYKSDTNKIILQLICFLLIQIPLCSLKDISKLQYASILGTIALVYSILVITIEMPFYLTEYLDTGKSIPWFKPISFDYLDTVSTFLFGFSSHNGIFQIFVEMKRPNIKRSTKVLIRSFLIEVVLYFFIGFFGYFSTFDSTPDVFLNRKDLFKDYFIKVAKISLFVCLHCSMAVNYNIMRMSFRSFFFNNEPIPIIKDLLITMGILGIANVGVFFIENVVQVLGFIGGVCTVVICFLNPIMIYVKSNEYPRYHWKNVASMIALVVVSILGTAATVKSFISFFTDNKQPDDDILL